MIARARKGKRNKTVRGGGRRFTRQGAEEDEFPIDRQDGSDQDDSNDESDDDKSRAPARTDDGGAESDDDAAPRQKSVRIKALQDEDSDDEGSPKAAGVETSNLNRQQKQNMKASELGKGEGRELTRREREQIEKERAQAAFWKAQIEGKTDQARGDLARLAIIKKQREEAQKKREETAAAAATTSVGKAASLNASKAAITKSLSGTSIPISSSKPKK
ncbi:hypothetical protein SeMB42_g07834 [Synchytrium endobioticum]|uniref:Casein kinase substrate phosphoprotein PP28 domain-containing protein n=1 Tax=Synchytrium endobioticum TaxID=286115 RepID=A0A507CBA2_9FUNG|nr:hypothetical protein SeMB42_g07834 [Synchytrium endobioticum]TPX36892.1 hypothetical protein SeLEV6574_g07959 [Synchytrium endobioticum]